MVLGTHQPLGGEVGDEVRDRPPVDTVPLRQHVQLKQKPSNLFKAFKIYKAEQAQIIGSIC